MLRYSHNQAEKLSVFILYLRKMQHYTNSEWWESKMEKRGWGWRWAPKTSRETNVADRPRSIGHRWQNSAYPVWKLQDGIRGGISRVRNTWEQRLYFYLQKGKLSLLRRVNCLTSPPPPPFNLPLVWIHEDSRPDRPCQFIYSHNRTELFASGNYQWILFCLWIIPTKIFLPLLLSLKFKFTGLQL